jgi:hypothetical protein
MGERVMAIQSLPAPGDVAGVASAEHAPCQARGAAPRRFLHRALIRISARDTASSSTCTGRGHGRRGEGTTMQGYEITELWVSKSCSMALVRTHDAMRETDRLYLANVLQHWIQPMRRLHARQRTDIRTGRVVRSEVYRLSDRMVVIEQQGERMQLAISSEDADRRYLDFMRLDPEGSPITRELLAFLEGLSGCESRR